MSTSAKKTQKIAGTATSPQSKITATSQTSRFHLDTISTLSREIDLKQVNVSIGNKDLIVDAHLRLKAGVHYALVGRNGEGKSVLLQAIADKIIPGVPVNMRILLVNQIQEEGSPTLELTITQFVVKSDVRREAASQQYELLSIALTDSNPRKISTAVAAVLLENAEKELVEAQKIALKRSGARGAEARKQLLLSEAKLEEAQTRVDEVVKGYYGATDATEASALLVDLQATLDVLGATTTEARARTILLGLGFTAKQLDEKVSTLSGGWRSRSSLASALLQVPDLLILDEPTNYLDLMSVIWLQEYLNSFETSLLIVAHDREFVDNVAQELITLRHNTLTYFDGNLSESERFAKNQTKSQLRMKDALDRKKDAMVKTIEQGFRASKKTGDENRARMAKSRQKKLDERWGLERSDKGGRFKLNRDMPGYFVGSSRSEIQIDQGDGTINMIFPNPQPMRFPGALISASKLSFSYPGRTVSIPVLQDVSITLHPGSRTALVGRNGEGKSTLVKLLVGTLIPSRGTIERHTRLKFGYFDQHSVERLSTLEISRSSALAHFTETVKSEHAIDVEQGTVRAVLGSFGLGGRKATDPIAGLSGGQKVRLALAILVHNAPDLLVLDEPSTHLDMDTITALIIALKRYAGAILVVSHDRHFVRCVVEGAPILSASPDDENDEDSGENSEDDSSSRDPGVVYMVGPKGRIKVLSGGVDEYAESMEKKMRKLAL